MIRSLGAKYNDMIAMHPIVSLNSEKLKELYFKVLKGVRLDSMFVLPWLTVTRRI